MDGVLTQTAEVHAQAWQRLFDAFFAHWNAQHPQEPKVFDAAHDYLAYIDGRPRFEAIRHYLAHQGIELPQGSLDDAPGFATVGALGNLKNAYFFEIIETDGVALYESTLDLIGELPAQGIQIALVTSSRNAQVVLAKTGLGELFEVVIDGLVAAERGLPGKPAPDTFLAACAELGVEATRAVLVEDAVSGVQAGARGGFALVVGLARSDNAQALRENGADIVFSDFAETNLEELAQLVHSKRAAS